MNAGNRHLTRRRFLGMLGGLALAGASGYGYIRKIEPGWLDVERIVLPIPRLPEPLAGMHLAQLSDIHLSHYTLPEQLLDAVETVNQLAPDVVLLTGDFVGHSARYAAGLVDPLRRLNAPAFAAYGNHDLWTHRGTVGRYLQESAVQILENSAVHLRDGLWLAGVDDIWSGQPDLKAALRDIPADTTVLLMAHEPDFFDRVIADDAPVAVQLSGHSHGGQIRLPALDRDGLLTSRAIVLPHLARRYPMGLRQVGPRQVYTNRGLGVWPLPYRFNCRPEVTLFTLQPT